MIIFLLLLSAASAALYRMGGIGDDGIKSFPKFPKWFFDTKARDFGCPFIALLSVFLVGIKAPWYIHFFSFGAMFGAMTTYWDGTFGEKEANYWLHGFMCGFAYILYAMSTGDWSGFIFRCIFLALFMGAWCKFFSNDTVEEMGRGFVLPISLLLMVA